MCLKAKLNPLRTIHFFVFVVLILFLVVHVLMVIMSDFKRQLRAMTFKELIWSKSK